jgi:predicted phage tail protein
MTVSLMDSNTTEYEELSKDPEKLLQHLSDRIEEISLTLDDDEDFCNKDIDASIKYVETIEKKFNEKIQELKGKLEQIRIENQKTSEQNKNQFSEQMETINELFTSGKHDEGLLKFFISFFFVKFSIFLLAWKKFKDYEKKFEQRPTAIRNIPKLHMNEMDVEQYFSSDYKSTKSSPTPSTIVISSTVTTNDDKYDPIDDNQLTKKEILRRKKIIETVHIDKDNEELNDEKTEQNVDE